MAEPGPASARPRPARDGAAASLVRPDGTATRVASLVNNAVTHDSRVLKTANTLGNAGLDVLVVGAARAGQAVGPAVVDLGEDTVAVYRVPDLDLVAMLPALASWVRRRRARRAAANTPAVSATTPASSAAAPAVPAATEPTRSATQPASGRARATLGDLWMRLYQTTRLTWFWLGVIRYLRHWRPDVVHANDGNTLVPALILKAVVGSAIVYDAHELWTHRNIRADRWLAPAVEAVTERLGVRAAAAVVTVSPSIAAWMRQRFRLPATPALVRNIPARTSPVADRSQGRLRDLAGLSPADVVVGYCGGITTGRGLEETVAALTELPEHIHLVLLGYGDPGYQAGLHAHAEGLQVAHRVHVIPPVPGPQVPATMADADVSVVFIRPICLSYRYALPNKLFESIHAGLPIVAADLPDMAQVVRDTRAGEVFASPAELADAITTVLADPEPYRAAARRAAEGLDWRFEADRLLGVYRRVLAGRRRR